MAVKDKIITRFMDTWTGNLDTVGNWPQDGLTAITTDTHDFAYRVNNTIYRAMRRDLGLLLDGTQAMAGDLDLDGYNIICDQDGDTKIVFDRDESGADDTIILRIGGADNYQFEGTLLTMNTAGIKLVDCPATGLQMTSPQGSATTGTSIKMGIQESANEYGLIKFKDSSSEAFLISSAEGSTKLPLVLRGGGNNSSFTGGGLILTADTFDLFLQATKTYNQTITLGGNTGLIDLYSPKGISLKGAGFAKIFEIVISDLIKFTASGSAVVDDTYTNNSSTFTVVAQEAITGSKLIYCLKTAGTNDPETSGTLTRASGTGDPTIAFSERLLNLADIGFFTQTAVRQQIITVITEDTAITELQNILIAYGLAINGRVAS